MMMYNKAVIHVVGSARIWVIWDIESCPLPSGCDPRRVAPCIKRALKNLGYSGPLTITAIGHDFPEDVLRSLSSTGISLYRSTFDRVNIPDAMIMWGYNNRPPANILLIAARDFSYCLEYLKGKGFNILRQILYDDSRGAFPTTTEVERLWKSFLTDTMDSEEKSTETSECVGTYTICVNDAGNDPAFKDFGIFVKHLHREHRERHMLGFLLRDYNLKRDRDEDEVEASLDSHPKNTINILNKEPMAKAATQKEAVARTWVIWDIKSCPVPPGYAHRVGPCIKRALENLGYSGPLTITAIGHLLDFPGDVLRSLSSTGISLYHIPLDVVNILDALVKWPSDNQPPANILLITARDFSDGLEYLKGNGFNILRQILYNDSRGAFPTTTEVESLWKSFLTDTMDSEEKSSETSECVWTCTVCVNDAGNDPAVKITKRRRKTIYLAGKGFENFSRHLSSRKHRARMLGFLPRDYKLKRDRDRDRDEAEDAVEAFLDSHPRNTISILNKEPMTKAATQEEAVARTWVIWDIKSCRVPPGYAHRVGLCIKRALENLGYSGPLTITAIGHLLDFPEDVLRSLSSTGISLYHIPFDAVNILDAMNEWGRDNQPPANILLITARDFSYGLEHLQEKGFNILRKILYDDSREANPTTIEVKSLWKSFLTGTMDSEEKSSETSECVWTCTVCLNDAGNDPAGKLTKRTRKTINLTGKGFEIFIEHLWSQEHRERMLEFLPCDYKLKREEDNEEVEAARKELQLLLNTIPRTLPPLLRRKNTE